MLWRNDVSATVAVEHIQSFLNQIFNHPICGHSTYLYEQILLIKFLYLLEDEIPSPFKVPMYSRSYVAASINIHVEEYTCGLVEREASNEGPGSLWKGSCITLLLLHIKITRKSVANCSYLHSSPAILCRWSISQCTAAAVRGGPPLLKMEETAPQCQHQD